MPMRHFDEQLQELLRKMVLMSSLAESMVQGAIAYLTDGSEAAAADVFRKEHDVNRLQLEVDEMAVRLTALQQPVGADVRFLFMASRIVSELERIGDQAINVCENFKHAISEQPLRPMVDLRIMAEIAQRMVRTAISAMVDRNIAQAEQVFEDEKKVDAFKDQIFRTLLTYMMGDPGTIQQALSLILISRNLERVGDHATNIAEEVIYMVQGRDIRHPADNLERSTSTGKPA